MAVENVAVKEGKVDLEALKSKDNLSEAEIEALGREATGEAEAKKPTAEELAAQEAERIAKEAEGQSPEEKAAAEAKTKEEKEAQETPEQKAEREKSEKEAEDKKAAEDMKAEEQRLLALDDKDEKVTAEDKQKKSDLIKLQTETKAKEAQTELENYARENSMSVEEAKKDLESIQKVSEKYENDPRKLAKATLHMQRMASKLQERNKLLELGIDAKAEPTVDSFITLLDKGMITVGEKKEKATREGFIEAYRKEKPDITENLDDDKVLKLAAEQVLTGFKTTREKFNSEQVSKAEAKKTSLLSILPEGDRKYVEDIKPVLDKLTPAQIMEPSLSINDMILWAKGVHHDDDVKAADEAGFKRGLEQARILGAKVGASKGAPAGGSPKKKSFNLTDAQKNEALDMYESAVGTPDDTKFEWYAELNGLIK